MGTSTGNSGTPLRRSLVFSQNTTYTSAAGVHSEISRRADAIQVSSQRQLQESVSSLQAAQAKHLKALQQHRKSLESSMLAYTEKMRKISTERMQLASKASGRTLDEKTPQLQQHQHHHHPRAEGGGGSFDRLLTASTSSLGASARDSRSKVSADSGVDVSLADEDVLRKSSSHKNLLAVPVMTSLPDATVKPSRASSFHSDVTSSVKAVPAHSGDVDGASSSSESRRRRAGTSQQPDLFALKLSMHRDSPEVASQQNPSAADDITVPPLAIMPFPESAAASPWIRVDESGILINPPEDSDRASGTSSRTSQASSKKLIKVKDNYWSYRNGRSPRHHQYHHRLSLQLPSQSSQASAQGWRKKNSTASEPPTPSPLSQRPLNHQPNPRPRPRPRRSNKTYHTSFRYSLAVDDVIQSLEGSPSTAVVSSKIRNVSESLPSLDVHDLRAEWRHRQTLEKPSAAGKRAESVTSTSSHHQRDHESDIDGGVATAAYPRDGENGDDEEEEEEEVVEDVAHDKLAEADAALERSDWAREEGFYLLTALSRERSRSAPDILHQKEECDGEKEEEEEEKVGVSEKGSSVLKTSFSNGAGASDNDLSGSSGAGQIRLPALHRQTAKE